MRCPENTIDDVKVAAPHSLHHADEQVGPFVRKILGTDQADRVTKLALDLLGTREHELDDRRLDRETIVGRDAVEGRAAALHRVVLFDAPVALDKVLERHRRHHSHVKGQVLAVAQKEQDGAEVFARLNLLQVFLGFK